MKLKKDYLFGVIWILIMVGVCASTLTLMFTGGSLFSSHWVSDAEYSIIERYSRLETIRTTLNEEYYTDVDDEALMNGAAKGMMAALEDSYTFYYTPEEMEARTKSDNGEYEGLGILIQGNDAGEVEVVRVYPDSPAERAGVQVGDCLLKINGSAVSGSDQNGLNAAVELIGGESGAILLEIRRGEESLQIDVERGDVYVPNVDYAMLDDEIGAIEIIQFSGSDSDEFDQALDALKASGAKGIIIDLRDNPGGLLDDAVHICDRILPAGTVVYTLDRNGKRDVYYSTEDYWDVPLAVLINDMSASASEIVAAAVQDYGRGTIIGETSYGKGIVQTLSVFKSDGAGMQYTTARYYTPSDRCIHGEGVHPDIEITDDPETEIDECVARAMEVLKEKIGE